VLFSHSQGKFQGITRKDVVWPALPILVLNFLIVMDVPNFFIVMYVPFSVSCVLFVCKCVLLPPGVNPVAVKYISYQAARGGAVFEALRHKTEGRGIDSRWCHWNFSLT
jgi:hypothetical protein